MPCLLLHWWLHRPIDANSSDISQLLSNSDNQRVSDAVSVWSMRHCGECQYGPGARETGHLFYTHFKGGPTSLGPFIAEQTALDICPPHSRLKQMCKMPSILERKFSVLEEGLADITWMVKSGQLRAWYCLKVSNSILSTRRTRLIPLSYHRYNRGYRWVGLGVSWPSNPTQVSSTVEHGLVPDHTSV